MAGQLSTTRIEKGKEKEKRKRKLDGDYQV